MLSNAATPEHVVLFTYCMLTCFSLARSNFLKMNPIVSPKPAGAELGIGSRFNEEFDILRNDAFSLSCQELNANIHTTLMSIW